MNHNIFRAICNYIRNNHLSLTQLVELLEFVKKAIDKITKM